MVIRPWPVFLLTSCSGSSLRRMLLPAWSTRFMYVEVIASQSNDVFGAQCSRHQTVHRYMLLRCFVNCAGWRFHSKSTSSWPSLHTNECNGRALGPDGELSNLVDVFDQPRLSQWLSVAGIFPPSMAGPDISSLVGGTVCFTLPRRPLYITYVFFLYFP